MRYFALVLVAAGVAACGAGTDSGWTITEERNAAGVPHVVNAPPAAGIEPAWTIESELRIGALEGGGPTSFGTIKGLAVLADGRIAVLDAQAQEIRIFGADGKHLRTFGGKGAGPGELNDANGLLIGRDGVIRVNDPRNSRLSFFHPDSGFTTSVPLDVKMYGYIWQAVIDSADHIWEQGLVITGSRSYTALKGYQPNGVWTDTIPQREREARRSPDSPQPGIYSFAIERGRRFMQVPFWPRPAATMDPRHAFWSKPSQENDYRLLRATFTGDTTLTFESRRAAVPVSQSLRDSAIAAIREDGGTNLDWSQIPDTRPIVTQLFVAVEGDVWVRVTTGDDSLTTFDVFGSNGRYRGTAVTPMRVVRFLEPVVRGDQFWAVVTDELDVPYVARGRLVRR